MKNEREVRINDETNPEVRALDDSTVSFRGYATVYDHWYPVAGGPDAGGWMEMVAPGAGARTLNTKPSVMLLLNHEGLPLASTRSGTMMLEEDSHGLIADVKALDVRGNYRAAEAYSVVSRGDGTEMSYAFQVTRQNWNKDYTERTIREYNLNVRGSDMSIVTWGANPATVSQVRSAAHIDELRSLAAAAAPAMSLDHLRAIATQIRVHA